MFRRTRALGLIIAILVSSLTEAQTDPATSFRPRVAGIARLVTKPKSAESIERIRGGLADAQASVRAASARVAHSMGLAELLPGLREALVRETDAETTRELAWAVAGLDTTEGSDAALVAAVTTSPFAGKVVRGLVAGRGPRVSALWGAIGPHLEKHARSVTQGLRDGLHRDAASMFASRAIRDGLPELSVELLLDGFGRPDPSVAVAGLGAMDTRVRSASYLVLADAGVAQTGEADIELKIPDSLPERVSRHLFETARRRPPAENLKDLQSALKADARTRDELKSRLLRARGSLRGLREGDRDRLLGAVGYDKRGIEFLFDRALEAPAVRITAVPGAPSRVLRTLGGHPAEFARSVIQESGCRGAERSFDGVEAVYGPGGRPTQVDAVRSASSAPGCAEVALVLGLSALATGGHDRALAILPERPEFLACLAEAGSDPLAGFPPESPENASQATGTGDSIIEPKKVRNLSPDYPKDALNKRVQGMVILETNITASGCIASIRVLRGIDLLMDLEAIEAVSGWKYSPALRRGVPIPVMMTVTVTFRLN